MQNDNHKPVLNKTAAISSFFGSRQVLVTGGGGFLGKAIVRLLCGQGAKVHSFSRSNYKELTELGVIQFSGDLTDTRVLADAAKGCDLVFHVAAKAGIWGKYEEFYKTNVTGTNNVLAACQQHGIKKLIYTSSPSVVFDGKDVENGNESLPYPATYQADYPRTKAMAEQLVLAANSQKLATVALRPHLIWGPEDNHLIPRIIAKAKSGKLRRLGKKTCLVDTVYVDNAAQAHLLAAEKLEPGSHVAGKAYFITNNEPVPLWEMVNAILAAAGLPAVEKSVPPKLAYAIGAACEAWWAIFKQGGEPPMTRFVASELSTSHWFDTTAAKRDFGYTPQLSIKEGLKRLQAWLQTAGTE